LERHRDVDVSVAPLLARELDVAPDRQSAALPSAPVRRLHDPRSAAGDDREALLSQPPSDVARGLIVGIVLGHARRTEDRDRRPGVGELVEAGDELARDAHYPPG